MTDLTPAFDGLLKEREAPATKRSYSVERIDEFLKEAYRINSHIAALHTSLLANRQAYLSTAAPRRTHVRTKTATQQPAYLTDQQRDEIDANAKKMLRELNMSIRALAEAEQVRQGTESLLIEKRHNKGLGALGGWAAGGGAAALGLGGKSPDQRAAEDAARQVGAHREAVLLYLRTRLGEAGQTQASMMEARLSREMEKSLSVLAKAGGGGAAGFGRGSSSITQSSGSGFADLSRSASSVSAEQSRNFAPPDEESTSRQPAAGLSQQQMMMFEKGNQDMVQHYESMHDKVRTAEQSLVEISELQTLLVNNLETQSAHVDQLVADSFRTEENVGSGNKQLKKATERGSPARWTFFAAGGLCLFLISWDLIF